MQNYQLQIKQIVNYPRCRIYRQFVQSLIKDRNLRTGGDSGLFYYTVLCSYANFRTSYRHLNGVRHTIYPGEWLCSTKELVSILRAGSQKQVLDILQGLQDKHLVQYLLLQNGKTIKFKIRNWCKTNTILDYNCPCQKDSGFFFISIATATDLISSGKCSQMDILLDLWISAIYNDTQVQGSDLGPVVYMRNGTGSPLLNYSELSDRWGISRATVCRLLRYMEENDYIKIINFTGNKGSVIYLQNYLSTMFQISDVLIDKEEVAMILNVKIALENKEDTTANTTVVEQEVTVPDDLTCVSKKDIQIILQKMSNLLDAQGVSCFRCPKAKYKLFNLSEDCMGIYSTLEPLDKTPDIQFGVSILCGDYPVQTFELTLSPVDCLPEGGC
ncbi:MAG: MarR family transcriptional regulator [Oscillospiraceae bacterium]|nr:MarR family transcriptional regulator [Oscillospiraceae bacterium]